METVQISSVKLLASTIQDLSFAVDLESIMRIVRRVARELTGADGATFILREGNLCYYADEDAISPLWKGKRFPMEACISGWSMINRKAVSIRDIYSDDRIPTDAYRPTFVKSLVMVPIRTRAPIGAIGNYWASEHEASKEEIFLLQSLADITAVSIENVQMYIELQKKLKERTEMLTHISDQKKQLEDFCTIISHNLRAPLANIFLISSMLEQSKEVEEKLLYFEKLMPVVNFLNSTFNDLVEAVQVRMDYSVKSDYLDVEECLQKAKNALGVEIEKSGAVVLSDFSQAKEIFYPKNYFDSIVFNLLSNAIKYRSSERVPMINLRTYLKDEWIYFEISDNGLGIDLEKQGDKIFKLGKTFHGDKDAKGFGLFITKNQVESMGGKIMVSSMPGKGTTFTVRLSKISSYGK
ncbi:MAG: sensor histidine kinase [Cytophagaceae bacterium]